MMNLKKIAIWALTSTVLTPFIVGPNLIAPYIAGKVLFLRGIAFAAFLLITLILIFSKEKEEIFLSIKKMVKNPLFLAVSVNMFFLMLSTIFAFDRMVAFFGEPQRMEGFLTIFSIYALFISFWLFFSKKDWNKYFLFSSLVSIALFFIGMYQISLRPDRPEILSGNPDFIGVEFLFYVFSGLCVLYEGLKNNKKYQIWLGFIASILSFFGILIIKTRSALVGFGMAFLVCIILIAFKNKEKLFFMKYNYKKISVSLLLIVVIFLGVFGLSYKKAFWQKVPGVDRIAEGLISNQSTNSRVIFAKISMEAFKEESSIERKLLGWGWDNYLFAWSKYYDPKVFYFDTAIADRAHNKLMDILVMTGVLGLLSYFSIWFFYLKKSFYLLKGRDITLPVLSIFFGISYFIALMFSFDIALIMLFFSIVMIVVSKEEYE